MSQCVWMLVQILGKKNLITLARKIKVKSKMKKQLSLEDIQLFLESRGRLQDAMQVENFMDNLSAVQIATANLYRNDKVVTTLAQGCHNATL